MTHASMDEALRKLRQAGKELVQEELPRAEHTPKPQKKVRYAK